MFNQPIVRFILTTVALYLLWFGLYEFWLKSNGRMDHLITENISIITCWLLQMFDYPCYYTIGRKLGETYLFIGDNALPTVRIGSSCNGLEMLVIFSIFIICYPGNKWLKLIFVVGGLFSIHLLNIIRNFVLTLFAIHRSMYFELFHRYVFIFLIYGVIFLLWMWWANSLSKLYQTNVE
jgi:exosortase family protein XrtF